MTIENILENLKYNKGVFPRKSLIEAIENRESIINELLEIIKFSTNNIRNLVEEKEYFAHIYAMYLLAQFREKRAYKLLIDFFSIPGDITHDFTGEVITEDLGRIFASVYDGDVDLLKSLIENEKINEYVRSAAIETLIILVAIGEKSRDEIIDYLKSLFTKLERTFSNVWNILVTVSNRLYPEEVFEEIKKAFDDNLVEPFFISIEHVEEKLKKGKNNALYELKTNQRYNLINDTIRELEFWACFKQPKRKKFKAKSNKRPIVTKKSEKIGRNKPCPCGSGKKYKKCCLNKNEK